MTSAMYRSENEEHSATNTVRVCSKWEYFISDTRCRTSFVFTIHYIPNHSKHRRPIASLDQIIRSIP